MPAQVPSGDAEERPKERPTTVRPPSPAVEPRIVQARAAYEERLARRWARGIGTSRVDIVEPDVERRAYVIAPVAPGAAGRTRT